MHYVVCSQSQYREDVITNIRQVSYTECVFA